MKAAWIRGVEGKVISGSMMDINRVI